MVNDSQGSVRKKCLCVSDFRDMIETNGRHMDELTLIGG